MKTQSLTIFLALLFLISASPLFGQRVLTLQTCVDLAYERSLELKNADLNTAFAEVGATQAKHARYPSLNAQTTYGLNVGRTIDPTTNAFVNQSSTFQTGGVNTSVPIYQGSSITNTIKQTQVDIEAAHQRKAALQDNIGLQVAQNYLNALLAEESQILAGIQMNLTENQLERIQRLIDAGSLPPNDRLELEAQLARDEQQIINAENSYQLAILNLKNILLIPVDDSITLERVDPDLIEIDDAILNKSLGEIYREALIYQPSIRADSLDLLSSNFDKKIAEGRALPSLSLGGSLSTNYSSLAQRVAGVEDVTNNVPLVIAGNVVDVGFPGQNRIFEDAPYGSQIGNNLGYGFGMTLSLPIYNNLNAKLNIERAELGILQTRNRNEINKQNLKATIQNAVAQARAAKKAYAASIKSVDVQRISLENLEKSLAAGRANNFDFISAKNNLNIAENSLVQSKYDYIFKLKVIDYYLGNPLKL